MFSGDLKLKVSSPGKVQIVLQAVDKAKNVSLPYTPLEYDVVPNEPPGPWVPNDWDDWVKLSRTGFTVGEKGVLVVKAAVTDDCGVSRAMVEMDLKGKKDKGFKRAGSLSDDGREGDEERGDDIWTGTVKVQCREEGRPGLKVVMEDTHGKFLRSGEYLLSCDLPE